MHPSEVLFKGEALPRALPVCDHYCGTEMRMRKALALQGELGPVFDITLDCEDGAPIGQEIPHAKMCADLITSPNNLFNRVGARIHDPDHENILSDIEILAGQCADKIAFITIPKVNSVAQTQAVIDQINAQSKKSGSNRLIPIQVLIETHGALADVFELAAIPQIESLSFGLMDFVSAHNGAIPASAMDRDQFKHPLVVRAMLEISAACHAFGKIPSHNVCTNINDPAVLRSDSLIAKDTLGYTRKWSIHPKQIEVIVESFRPSLEEGQKAMAILGAAADAHWGPIQYEGNLHDRASYRYYWTVLQRAIASGMIFPEYDERSWG